MRLPSCVVGSSSETMLPTVITEGNWKWPPAQSDDVVEIQSQLPQLEFGKDDKPMWTSSTKGIYVSADTWEALRVKLPTVPWWRMIWFSLTIPKHAFILWLVARDGLTTGEKLLHWGFTKDVIC
jgi:hypothetical protein